MIAHSKWWGKRNFQRVAVPTIVEVFPWAGLAGQTACCTLRLDAKPPMDLLKRIANEDIIQMLLKYGRPSRHASGKET